MEHWAELEGTGHTEGPPEAAVTIVEFGDFECPACGMFETRTLAGIRSTFRQNVRIVFRHWPLGYHRFAYPAAKASECAAEQGRFQEYRKALYEGQDSLGLKSFVGFVLASGVPDTASFAGCLHRPGKVAAVERDLLAANGVGASGTPAVIVNGLLVANALDSAQFNAYVSEAIKKGRIGT